jgi:hypothetical protein
VFVVLFAIRMAISNASGEILFICFVFLSAVGVCLQAMYFLVKWLAVRGQGEYDCPVCGDSIVQTPHQCPSCGTRLIWGYLPGPGDRRHPQVVAGEQHGRLAV